MNDLGALWREVEANFPASQGWGLRVVRWGIGAVATDEVPLYLARLSCTSERNRPHEGYGDTPEDAIVALLRRAGLRERLVASGIGL